LQVQENHSYLDQATQGESSPWRYLAGTFSILFIWLIIGGIATTFLLVFLGIYQGLSFSEITQSIFEPELLGYIPYYLLVMFGFLFLYFGTWITVRLIHKRPLRSLVTGRDSVNWRRIGIGFLAWLALILLGMLVEFLVSRDSLTFTFDARIFIPFTVLAILITPIQTTAEELFFRGYIVQAGSLINRSWIFLSIWSGVLFALPHILNPEVSANFAVVMLTFFVLGAFLTWISLKDGSIELAIGVHAAQNLAALLLVTFPDSALPSPAIFTTPDFNPVSSLIAVIITCVLFYLIFFFRRGRTKHEAEVEIVLD
jgi:membrane protease YdiL (CAAX protease family)